MIWTQVDMRTEFSQAQRIFNMLLDIAEGSLHEFHLRISLSVFARMAAFASAKTRLLCRFWRCKEHNVLSFWPLRRAGWFAINAGGAHSYKKCTIGAAISFHKCLPVLFFNIIFHMLHFAFLLTFLKPCSSMIRHIHVGYYPFLAV